MNIHQHSSTKNKLSKWLFAVFLILSFFTFSGVSIQSPANYQKPKTTVLAANNQRVEAKSISYSRVLAQKKQCTFTFQVNSLFEISLAHSRHISSRISCLLVSYMRRPQTGFYFPVKTQVQNADDEPALSLG
jgi:hypothetical protein